MHITTKTQIMIITETDTIGIIVTRTIFQAVLKKAIIMQLIISKNRFHQPKEGMEPWKKTVVIQFIGKSLYFRWNSEKIVKVSSEERKLTREEKRRRRRASIKYRTAHATRERMRVEAFNSAFGTLRQLLPTLPPDKKLSKIEILRLAICYIKYLDNVLKPELVDSGTSPNFQ